MSTASHPAAPHDLPFFITEPGQTDVLFVAAILIVVTMVLLLGVLFFWLHSLPERVAHKSKKLQFEIVAILGLLSLLTHQHIFWVAALLLAFIEIPNFSHPLRSMAQSLEKLAGAGAPQNAAERTAPEIAAIPAPVASPGPISSPALAVSPVLVVSPGS